MKRKIHIMIICISLLILLTGCWNRRELNELAIVTGLGIDKSGDQFIVSTQVVNPREISTKGGSSTGKTPVIVYKKKGTTIFEAIRKITTVSPRKLYFAHLQILVLEEELAKKGIGETLDFLLRDHELRTDFYIVIAKGTNASNVLKVLTQLENIPTNQLFASLETSQKTWAPTISITLEQLSSEIVSDGIETNITGIVIDGDVQTGGEQENVQQIESSTKMQYKGIGVFKDDKLIGWLDEDESKGLNYVLGKVKSTIVNVPCKNKGKTGIEVIRTKSDLKTRLSNGTLKGTVKLQVEGNIADVECRTLDLKKTKTISDIEKKTENIIKGQIEKALKINQEEYKTDLFGFGKALHRSEPVYWKKVKKEWKQKFSDMPVTVEVNVKIRRIGTIGDSPLNKIKE